RTTQSAAVGLRVALGTGEEFSFMPAIPCHERPERVCFERSVLPLTRSLRSSALRMARSPADADDLVQETVLRAWRFWPSYTERDSCRAWLHRILRNTFVS